MVPVQFGNGGWTGPFVVHVLSGVPCRKNPSEHENRIVSLYLYICLSVDMWRLSEKNGAWHDICKTKEKLKANCKLYGSCYTKDIKKFIYM